MRPASKILMAASAVAALAVVPAQALAWGAQGHRMVGVLGVQALPKEVPAFLRTAKAASDVGELAREPDRTKGAGKVYDHDRNAGHFLDLEDDGRVLGGPRLDALPATKADYETALRAAGQDMWKAGYLPYSIIDGWQLLTKDFTYWRILTAAEKREKNGARKAYYRADLARRQALIVRDLGVWAHYIGDGSQPLHVTAHYNGWGDYPNPNNYAQDRSVHGVFEGEAVGRNVTLAGAAAAMPPLADCNCPIEQRTKDYLTATNKGVETVYQLWAKGAFKGTTPEASKYLTERVADGAAQLRDLTVAAWRASATGTISYRPEISVADVESGKVDPWLDLYGKD